MPYSTRVRNNPNQNQRGGPFKFPSSNQEGGITFTLFSEYGTNTGLSAICEIKDLTVFTSYLDSSSLGSDGDIFRSGLFRSLVQTGRPECLITDIAWLIYNVLTEWRV